MIYPVKRYPMVLWNRFIPEQENRHLAVDIMNGRMEDLNGLRQVHMLGIS